VSEKGTIRRMTTTMRKMKMMRMMTRMMTRMMGSWVGEQQGPSVSRGGVVVMTWMMTRMLRMKTRRQKSASFAALPLTVICYHCWDLPVDCKMDCKVDCLHARDCHSD